MITILLKKTTIYVPDYKMENLLFGVLTIIFSAVGYFFSWKQQTRNNYKVAILLLMLCGLILRIYTASDFFLHDWDERFHALVAKNILSHFFIPTLYDNPLLPYNYRDWSTNHIWVHKQPLPLWTMAISMKLFGVNEIALRLPSVILSTIGIGLTYTIGCYFFNPKTAFFAAFLYSVNGLIIELSAGRVATDHFDVFMLFFVELAVFFSVLYFDKRRNVFNLLVGLSIGAAILSKWLPALIVIPIWLLMAINTKLSMMKIVLHLLIIILVAAIVAVPWQLYIYSQFPEEARWEAAYNIRHITEVLSAQSGSCFYYLEKIRINYGELIYLPLVWFVYKVLSLKNDFKRLAICLWFLIPFLFFSYAKTKMQGYILFASPALFFITADFFQWLFTLKVDSGYRWLKAVVLFLFVALPVRYCIERIKPFSVRDRNPEWVVALREMKNKNIQRGVLFNYNRPIEAMFYTNFIVYYATPTQAKIDELLEKGYTVIINNSAGNLPDEIKNRKDILIENLPELQIHQQ